MSKIKTRFAPSPTGYLHIGGARTALFAWLYAKSNQGECLLRIEDTDKARSKEEYTEEIINSFKWLGITFDQETIFQSHNTERYKEMVGKLIENGSAYVWDASHRDPEEILECEGSGGHSCRWCKWNQERDFINFTRDWQEGME